MLYSLYHLGKSSLDSRQKLVWCLVIIFIPFGFVAYLLAKPYKSQKSQQ
ncbi:MAG: PLD nuclease N-terminal domain-containing protein [Flavobacterium sp.]